MRGVPTLPDERNDLALIVGIAECCVDTSRLGRVTEEMHSREPVIPLRVRNLQLLPMPSAVDLLSMKDPNKTYLGELHYTSPQVLRASFPDAPEYVLLQHYVIVKLLLAQRRDSAAVPAYCHGSLLMKLGRPSSEIDNARQEFARQIARADDIEDSESEYNLCFRSVCIDDLGFRGPKFYV